MSGIPSHANMNRSIAVRLAGTIAREGLFLLLAMVYILPVWWVVASALRPASSLYQYASPLTWRTFVPSSPTLSNIMGIFSKLDFGRAIANSALVSGAAVALGVVVNSMAGFALAKFEFPGRSLVFLAVLVAFIAPFDAIVIPLHLVVSRMGFLNTRAALVLPAVGNGLAIFLFKQFYEEIPSEIIEAARVDGASWFCTFWRIVMPMSIPAAATVVVMLFMFQWNSLFWPLVAAFSSKYRVVQTAIAMQITADEAHWAYLFASAAVGSLPPVALFLLLQKHYIRGIAGGGSRSETAGRDGVDR
ncbi:MAG: carbohydrate ABC transporter permease [Clostridia bacterium]|nr:carbohydrate ABC transporter permease [Clostridia bacterium]